MTLEPSESAPKDFDFIIGSWRVKHRRLKERLCGCTEWEEFDGLSATRKTLGGYGNLEDNFLALPGGGYNAIAVRSYHRDTAKWLIWWLDGRNPGQLETPVAGSFNDSTGLFFADDVFKGKAIKVRFIWSLPTHDRPRWEQAFSADNSATWETNWTMEFTRDSAAR